MTLFAAVVVVSDEPFCKTLVQFVLVRPTSHLQRHDDAPLGDEIHGNLLNCSDLYLKSDSSRQVWVHDIASFDMQQSPTLPSALCLRGTSYRGSERFLGVQQQSKGPRVRAETCSKENNAIDGTV